MKTAISIPDPIYRAADRLARRLRVSRSQLYANAVSRFIEQHRGDAITKQLNDVYAGRPAESRLPRIIAALQSSSIPHEKW